MKDSPVRAWIPAAALAGLLLPVPASACAGCRNPNMPVSRVEALHLRPGEVRVGAVLGATWVKVAHDAGCVDLSDCTELPIQPLYRHDQFILPGEVRGVAELGFTSAFSLEAHLPFRVVHTTIAYLTPEGEPYEPLDPDIHHRDETLAGLGDPWLLARWSGRAGSWMLAGRAGFSLPLGRTESNPFTLGDRGLRHQHIQFGSGTVEPILALDLAKGMGRWQWQGYAQGQASLYENSHGFRAGPRLSGGVQAGRRIKGSLSGALGLDGWHEGAERWDGAIRQDGNLGRSELQLALSLSHRLRTASGGLSARFPLYRRIESGDEPPGEFSSPVTVSLAFGRSFQAW